MKQARISLKAVLVAVMVFGCNEQSIVPPPTFTLLEISGWAATDLHAVANQPVDSALLRITLDGAPLAHRVLDDTVAIRLPRGVAQGHLVASYGDAPAFEANISIADFQDSYLGPTIRGFVLPVANGGAPVILATGDSSLVRIDLRPTPTVQAYPTTMHATQCGAAPGPTSLANVFALDGWAPDAALPGGGSCTWRTWLLGTTQTALDSSSALGGSGYIASEIGSGVWLWATPFAGGMAQTTGTWSGSVTELRSIRISPKGDVATFTHGDACCGGHAPVLDAVTGQPRYSLTSLIRNWAAAFSTLGDTLYVVGRDTAGAAVLRIQAIDAAGGSVLQTVGVPDSLAGDSRIYGADDVMVDPVRPYLYLFTEPNLTVFDRRTLQPITQLHGVEPASSHVGWARLVLSPAENMLYAVEAPNPWNSAAPAPIYRFRLPS